MPPSTYQRRTAVSPRTFQTALLYKLKIIQQKSIFLLFCDMLKLRLEKLCIIFTIEIVFVASQIKKQLPISALSDKKK